MESAKIMVVEDEGIIAQDIKNCLENLGYTVPEVVFRSALNTTACNPGCGVAACTTLSSIDLHFRFAQKAASAGPSSVPCAVLICASGVTL